MLAYLCHLRAADQLLLVIDCPSGRSLCQLQAHPALHALESQASRCAIYNARDMVIPLATKGLHAQVQNICEASECSCDCGCQLLMHVALEVFKESCMIK